MKIFRSLLALAALPLAAGCGPSQARVYRLAVDPSVLLNLPTTCYRNNATQYDKTTWTNYKLQYDVAIWDGVDGKSYLDMGQQTFNLGNAVPVKVIAPIEGAANVYTATVKSETIAAPNDPFTDIATQTITVAFTEVGAAARGTITLRSEYSCTNCSNNNAQVAKCEAALNFTGRRIDYGNISTVDQNP
jgi:hypothetical protein